MNFKIALIFSLVGTALIGLTVAFAPGTGQVAAADDCCDKAEACCAVECDPKDCVPCDDEDCAEICKDSEECCVIVCCDKADCDESACAPAERCKGEKAATSCTKADSACCGSAAKKS